MTCQREDEQKIIDLERVFFYVLKLCNCWQFSANIWSIHHLDSLWVKQQNTNRFNDLLPDLSLAPPPLPPAARCLEGEGHPGWEELGVGGYTSEGFGLSQSGYCF